MNSISDPNKKLVTLTDADQRQAQVKQLMGLAQQLVTCAVQLCEVSRKLVDEHTLATLQADIDAMSGDVGTKDSWQKLVKRARAIVDEITSANIINLVPSVSDIEMA